MPSKVSKDGDHQAPRTGPSHRPKEPGPAYRLTSRNFSLNTRFFTLDLSWRRVEMATTSSPPHPPPSHHPTPVPDFEEVLRRLKLYALLEPPSPQYDSGQAKVSPASLPTRVTRTTI